MHAVFFTSKVTAQNGYFNIAGLNITQINGNQINANLKVYSPVFSIYNSYETEINENVITLKVCYTVTLAQAETNLDNDFQINLPTTNGNYTLKVKVYRSSTTCTYESPYLEDTATLDFTTTFSGTISLITSDIDSKNKNLKTYPNPVKDILNFSEEVSNVKITDFSGKTVKQISASGKSVTVSTLAKGVYIITATAKSGKTVAGKIIKE